MGEIRIGVVGITGVGQNHLKLASKNPNARVKAICDLDSKLLNIKSKEYGVNSYSDYKQMLDNNIIDAVIICTPHHLHHKMVLDFLKSGIHVLVEKPLANTVKEADELVKTAEVMNLKLGVGHQYRTHRSSQIMRNIVESGEIGKIMRVLWTWSSFRTDKYYQKKPWHATWKESGAGVLMNQVSHDIDLVCWLTGKPVEVNATLGNQLHDAEIEDIVCANILFENGIYGTFQFTINQPEFFSVRQIVGEKGALIINNVKSLHEDGDDEILVCKYEDNVKRLVNNKWNPNVLYEKGKLPAVSKNGKHQNLKQRIKSGIENLYRHHGNSRNPEWFEWNEPIRRPALLDNFINAVMNDEPLLVDGKSALDTIEVINAIILSAVKKETVKIPVDREEYQEVFNNLSTGKLTIERYRN